jgi:23S rRNA (guanosine2251-2'-O)-methyltransferase
VESVAEISVTQSPQGLVGDAVPLPVLGIEDVVDESGPAAILVLDHLQDPRNVGAIARSAVAAGFQALVVPSRRAAPVAATAFKAAAGALERIPVVEVSSVATALDRLRDRGVWLVGLDADGDRSIIGLDLLTEPVALVVGAEGRGLGRLVRDKVDVIASIPHAGAIESLNVSVAASLAMYELARVRGWVS